MPPTMLIQTLESVRRRVRFLGAVFGVGLVLASAVALLLALGITDYLLNLPAIARLLLILSAAGATLAAFWYWIARPLLTTLTLGDVAGRLEQAFPQFQDRLRSTVDIISGHIPGSEMMKQRVVNETTNLAQHVDLTRGVVVLPVWYSTAAGVGSILFAIILMLVIGSQYTQTSLTRLFRPFSDRPWPKTVKIDLVGAVPPRVAVGQRIDVNIRLAHGDKAWRKATIFYQYGDEAAQRFGAVEQEYMTRGDDGIYHASLDARIGGDVAAATGAMNIWMKSGDGELVVAPVKIVQRLAVRGVHANVTPPAYASLPMISVNLGQNPAVMTVGSQVVLTASFSKPLDKDKPATVESLTPDTPVNVQWEQPAADTLVGRLMAATSLRFRLRATDVDGFQNTAVEEYELIVRPDQNPAVQIENPRRSEDRTPVAVVPLQAIAEDDFGIKSMKLIVERLGDRKRWEIPLVESASATNGVTWSTVAAAGDLQRFRANYAWDLANLSGADLKPGDVLEYFALVQDNFELNGVTHAPVPSGKLRINLISQEEFSNKVTDELRTIGEQVAQVKQGQGRTHRETIALAKESQDKPGFDPGDKVAAERLESQQSNAAAQTKQLSGKLDEVGRRLEENKSSNQELKETARDVGELLNKTAEAPMKDAAGAINAAKQAPAKDDRNADMQLAQAEQQTAGEQLQKALDRMGNIGSLSRTIDQIKAILEEQQRVSAQTQAAGKSNLGKRPDEMDPKDRQKLESTAKEQADLAKRTAKALSDMQQMADKLSKSDPAAAQAMKEAASTGQQQNVSQNQSKAAQAAQQNQQSQAQSSQKQAELGLQMMLNNLREAERRKLEELARKLEDLQKQIANLIRRQAGHNLDNLALQGPELIAKMETKQRDELFTKAERDAKTPSAIGELGMLSGGQEQTERNTRDIAKSVEDLPEGAEPADRLSEAANKMERAIVSLRERKLAEAYNPPQVAALAALDRAKKFIDEQKASVDQKREDQQKEAIRAVYVKLKEAQEKLNVETKRIDVAPKLEDGSLRREDGVRLGQLPGEQGGLADRTAKLEEDLSALGSIVYVWANKDIVGVMKQVKEDLATPDTGGITQVQQKRIVQQLDAMIRNLAVKPFQSKFASKGGGGGGGGKCSPGLPSESELRLLKDLQLAVNDGTREIAALQKKEQPMMLSLGQRQGDMRGLLDQLLQKTSRGEMKLGPEPDNRDQLPEEATAEQVENQELDKTLLDDQPGAEIVQKDMDLVGDRMARARQRLTINNDPGKVTQLIQERIVLNLDDLIEMARKKEAQQAGQPDPNQRPQQAMSKPKPNPGVQPQNNQANGKKGQGGVSPAANSNNGGPGAGAADVTAEIKQKMAEWGGLTPRQREAVIEGAGDQVLDKYKTLVDDYYRSLATKSNGQ